VEPEAEPVAEAAVKPEPEAARDVKINVLIIKFVIIRGKDKVLF
jgi:hypothetical protein